MFIVVGEGKLYTFKQLCTMSDKLLAVNLNSKNVFIN